MKIKPEHVEYMRKAMMAVGKPIPTLASYTARGLSEKRWGWLWNARVSRWISDNIYPYADNEYIDTALRQITKGLK